MGVTWTEEQQKVIELRDRNILVSAAAGSGKTAVLVERIITMLTDDEHPIDVDRLLIVTFTEAAASEMKERIRDAIEKKLKEDPGNEHLMQQATLIHSAQITTIHSFCLSVIRDHFHAIDMDPSFRIGEEGELKLLKQDVLEELLEERYETADPAFLRFVAAYGSGKTDKKIEELILKIFEYSRSYPDAGEWLDQCIASYQIESKEELENSLFIQLVKRNVSYYLEEAKKLLLQALEICNEEDGPIVYTTTLDQDMWMIEVLSQADTFEAMTKEFQNISWARLASNRDKTVSEEKIRQVKSIRDDVKSMVGELATQYFYQDIGDLLEDLRLCLPAAEELVSLVRAFSEKFEEKKKSQNMIDFSDMEQYALRILTEKKDGKLVSSAIAREYKQQYQEIMIDEYQDSNLIQETILNSISTIDEGRYNIFMVGDVKQSIYRFRLSRPELFMEKFDTYDTEDSKTQRIDLHKNFRSRGEVLESINLIFQQIMTKNLGGIEYDDQAALYTGAAYPQKDGLNVDTEVIVIDSDAEGTESSAQELEARALALRIRELVGKHLVTDKKTGELRPARYSDIVILTRSIQGFADVFTEVLNREGIPTYAGTREGYFATQEIGVILDYLRVLDNRRQDLPLAAVLTSAVGGFTNQELAEIKAEYPDLPFWKAVIFYIDSESGEPKLQSRLRSFMEQMDQFRKIVPYTSMHELLWKILDETGYKDYASAMPGGAQRRANLEMLVEKARAFESTSYKGLFHFIRYIEQLQKYDVDYGEANVEDEQSDTVRVMTIHKSKGLEFPIVFAAGMGKGFNLQDARRNVVLHARMGIGLDAVDLEHRTKSPSIVKKVIQKEESLDTLAEELRILYVALTRAREKLIITGKLSNLEKRFEWYGMVPGDENTPLPYYRLSKAGSYWDWILPAVMRIKKHPSMEIRVLTAEEIAQAETEKKITDTVTRQILERWDTDRIFDPEMHEKLREQFEYHYPYESGKNQKLKFTVSELKKRIYLQDSLGEELEEAGEQLYEEPEIIPLIPAFLQEEQQLTGALRGTAYHRLMELLDFQTVTEDYGESSLEKDLEIYVAEGRIGREDADCIWKKDVLKFLNSSIGKRVCQSARCSKLWKEQPFVLGVSAKEIYPNEQEDEQILVQGIIDVYFEEEDGLVVLDYKTDKVYSADSLVERYHGQLEYYAKALEQITGKTVKEKIIYSFTLGEEIRLS